MRKILMWRADFEQAFDARLGSVLVLWGYLLMQLRMALSPRTTSARLRYVRMLVRDSAKKFASLNLRGLTTVRRVSMTSSAVPWSTQKVAMGTIGTNSLPPMTCAYFCRITVRRRDTRYFALPTAFVVNLYPASGMRLAHLVVHDQG